MKRPAFGRRLHLVLAWHCALLAVLLARPGAAAYFFETHRGDTLDVSDRGLKTHFVVTGMPRFATLNGVDAMQILAAPDADGLFEQNDGIRGGGAQCGEDGKAARR